MLLSPDRPWTPRDSPAFSIKNAALAAGRTGRTHDNTKAVVVVAFGGGVPVAVGRTRVLGIVVPGTAVQDTLGSRSGFRDGQKPHRERRFGAKRRK